MSKKVIFQLKPNNDMLPEEGYNYDFNLNRKYTIGYDPSTKKWTWVILDDASEAGHVDSVNPNTSKS